jgi:hypothetical protein
MKFKKLDLLTLLIGLFFFASCENTSTIGLEVDPSIAIKGTLVDTLTISSRTIKEEVTQTRSQVRYPLGFLNDPIFGTTEANLALCVNVTSAGYSFGTTPEIDSAVLVLNYGGEFYGDSTINYTVNVHQLDVNLARENSFLSNKIWPHQTTSIGTKTAKIYPNTRFKVLEIVTGKPDTLRTVLPQIRIPLNKTFIQNNIVNASTEILKNNQNFTRFFKGLYVKINQPTGSGGVMFFDLTGTNSGVYIYYKRQNTTTTGRDTIAANFPINSSLNPTAASIQHNYTGTAIATQLSNPNVQYPVTYIQPLAGLRNKISFPHLSKFVARVGKIAINKAELIIDLSAGTNLAPFTQAPRIALYRYDIAERRKNIPDGDIGTSQLEPGDRRALPPNVFGGYFNSLTRQYVFVITSYLQDIVSGKTEDYGTFLGATPLKEYQIFPTISTGARTVIGSYKKTPVAGDHLMKLNVYYTKID